MPNGLRQAARRWRRWNRLWRQFTGCALRDTATQTVFADGAADAPLMLIGDAPGAEEDRAGRPFVGPAGLLLDQMLGSIGLDRAQLRLGNVIPWRPPGNRNPTESEVALCLPFLLRHIALVRPRGVCLLGAVAAKAVLPEPERNLGHKAATRGLAGGADTGTRYADALLRELSSSLPAAHAGRQGRVLARFNCVKGMADTLKCGLYHRIVKSTPPVNVRKLLNLF